MAINQHNIQLDLFLDRSLETTTVKKKRPPVSEETRRKMRENRLGKKWSEEMKSVFSRSHKGLQVGEKSGSWKGGEVELLCKTCEQPFKVRRYRVGRAKYCSRLCWKNDQDKKSTLIHRIRNSKEYRDWRVAVFLRDDFTCQLCGKQGGFLNADHIKPFALFPELRFDLNNGRTLCRPCHHKTETFGVYTWRRKDFFLNGDEQT